LPENTLVDAPPGEVGNSSGEQVVFTEMQMKAKQKRNILSALKLSDWRVSGDLGAARLLGVKPTTLADRMKAFGIKKPA
jgi:transcriptional regulator with GAF, ATPase, and Fis domain